MTDPAADDNIRDMPLAEILGERYLSYALSTIMSRSLPDVRDGLKPVHRRLLFAMRELHLNPGSGFKKCARVVGDVIGKYHPHGDVAVYDALVRLAQEFAVRYPLVEGQGNFGNIDGDSAAAMRYTEARLTAVAEALLDGIDEDAVDFRATYDGDENEPLVLPARFPNLLANGAMGIAVGMATNIPPHNVGEICAALSHLLKHPKASIETLLEKMPGPDFPTGGVLVESREAILQAYSTGRGGLRLRARWEVEKAGRGQYRIVVTEIPYQVQKAVLIEKIADLMNARKLVMLGDVRDESTTDLRLILEPKSRTVEPDHLMESLFRLTDLETHIGVNMNLLDADAAPRMMNLRQILQAFLDHRHVVLLRRARHRLGRIERRLEVLRGYMVVYADLDEVIAIIRGEDEPKPVLMKRFGLSDFQAESILNMRLRALRRLEEDGIRIEFDALTAEGEDIRGLLKDEKRQRAGLAAEIKDIGKQFGGDTELGRRRTEIGAAPAAVVVPIEAMIQREPITVVCSAKGWLRAVKGHLDDDSSLKFRAGDRARFLLRAQTTDKLVLFATNGRFYTIGCDRLPRGRDRDEPITLMVDLGTDQEVVALMVHRPGGNLLVASSGARGFIVAENDVIAQTRAGKQVLNPGAGSEAAICVPAEGDSVAVVGDNRKLLIFARDEIPMMARGRGVILQRFADGGLADAKVFAAADGLTWRAGARTRTENDPSAWRGKRGQAGRIAPKGFPRTNRFA